MINILGLSRLEPILKEQVMIVYVCTYDLVLPVLVPPRRRRAPDGKVVLILLVQFSRRIAHVGELPKVLISSRILTSVSYAAAIVSMEKA